MKKKTDTIKQQPLLYIHTITNSDAVVPMQTEFLLELGQRPVKKKEEGKVEYKVDNSEKTDSKKKEAETKKIEMKPFLTMSLEEKVYYLINLSPNTSQKICKIITGEGEYVGKVVGYKNEIVEVMEPNSEKSLFLTIKEMKELYVIGI